MTIIPLLALSSPLLSHTDSIKNFDIEEAVVVASPKETQQLRRQALSVSLFDAQQITNRQINSLKSLSSYAPNVHIPTYGSRLTSACYIRGIGSRINTPAVGLYVDNVPYVDKSSYDFSFKGIERIDVLRGPQGTLYGRNSMGGIVRVFTADPITHHGTTLSAGWTSRTGGRRASLTTYAHPAPQMGLGLSAYYEGANGFFRNAATSNKQDGSDAAGARARWSWRPTDVVRIDWTASYEYSDEDACPYFWQGTLTDNVFTPRPEGELLSQNRPSSYRRQLANTGLSVEHRLPRVTLSSITSFQHLTDRLFMDQDFTAADVFTLEQRQFINTVTEEIALKSPEGHRRWEWSTGLFGMYQHLRTTCPVTFYADGLTMLNRQLAAVLPTRPAISIAFTGNELPFNARLVTPSSNLALFHQSTINDILTPGLSLTLGLRVDYDNRQLTLNSPSSAVPFHFGMQMGPSMSFNTDLSADAAFSGHLHNDSWQVLPKASINYQLPDGLGNIYTTVSKGYRAGGYNIQSYSELSQSALKRSMMQEVKSYSTATINRLPLPDASKQAIIGSMSAKLDELIPAAPEVRTLHYKPEYTWSYEAGIHHNLAGKTLQLDLSTFYMKTRDQQLARFAPTGLGRVMVNAGRSRSLGVEAALRSILLHERLQLSATYGYTRATFTNYDLGTSTTNQRIDYTGNRVPFVPEHTFSLAADYRHPLSTPLLTAFALGADLRAAGSIMWDEANTFSQPLYATLNARLSLDFRPNITLTAWASNLTNTHFATFAFNSMNNRFAQPTTPRHFGVDLTWKF